MKPDQIAKLKQRLLSEKRDLQERTEENDHYQLQKSMSESIDEISMYDNHPADIATEMFEREKDFTLYDLDRETLREIDKALQRMEEGTYGICTVCGKPIPEERLEALPQAQTCVEHAPSPDINLSRPVEEQFLQPPFGRTSLDENDQTGFDGEDAWQIVESWGTSSTPFSYQDPDKRSYDNMYIESDENVGFVEDVEQIGYTDIHGYHGPDSVNFMRSDTYEEYMNKGEGKGNYLDYDQYAKERAEDESGGDLR